MNKLQLTTLILAAAAALPLQAATQQEKEAAEQVIRRFAGKNAPELVLQSMEEEKGLPAYSTSMNAGKLTVKGSDGVALCKGYYDFVRSKGAGIYTWSGKRHAAPAELGTETPETKVVSPVKYHTYFNVVTYGYTLPYWDWERWEQEIDWMALHGIDTPLALVAHEAISARVFRKLGLTDEEIAKYFVGPAHLPWMRMGNISGIDGPLPKEWHEDQIALQHKILKRMRSLGMHPVCPGFAGFVPPALKRLYPEANIVQTSWCSGAFHNWMLMPNQDLFTKIGTMFIEEWEKEFGKNTHYIIDSFNEMEVPFPPHGTAERYELLATYGDKVYSAIRNANPDAVWVMQGWMFGYQRKIWDQKTLAALLSKVPDDKMMLIDLAVDYNKHFWRNGYNWDLHKGYYNKPWVYSVVPNMGGKCGLTGVLEFYANNHLEALNSPNKGKLSGIGMSPEGVENNEVLYELMAAAGWSDKKVDLMPWLLEYSRSRYGKSVPEIEQFWQGMLKSVYGSFTDHPRYNWQNNGPGGAGKGSIRYNEDFFRGIEAFASAHHKLGKSELYRADLMELSAAYLGARVEQLIIASEQAWQMGDEAKSKKLEEQIETLMLTMDRLLSEHPTQRLELWLERARKKGNTPTLKDYYERNARRIVTIWGPPVNDYSARIWSGLIRDFYLPRRKAAISKRFDASADNDWRKWERNWAEKERGLSPANPFGEKALKAAATFIKRSQKWVEEATKDAQAGNAIGNWSPESVSTGWKEISWNVSPAELRKAKSVAFVFKRGNHRLDIREVKIEMDGAIVCHVQQNGFAGKPSRNNVYRIKIPKDAQGNNTCTIRASVRCDGGNESYGSVELR